LVTALAIAEILRFQSVDGYFNKQDGEKVMLEVPTGDVPKTVLMLKTGFQAPAKRWLKCSNLR
jgi:hypothetical protein